MNDKLDYIETQGRLHMAERVENANFLQQEGNTSLTVFLSGAGAILAYAAQVAGNGPVRVAALAASIYLFAVAAVLVHKVLGIVDFPPSHNTPANLMQAEGTLEELRMFELDNLQQRLEEAGDINQRRSVWLNRCRYAAILTPAVALIVWAAAVACL